jgi:hypothetical protein
MFLFSAAEDEKVALDGLRDAIVRSHKRIWKCEAVSNLSGFSIAGLSPRFMVYLQKLARIVGTASSSMIVLLNTPPKTSSPICVSEGRL